MGHNILGLPKSVKRKSLESLYGFFNKNYKDMSFVLIDLTLFFKRYDIGLAKSISERARLQFPFHPGLKKVDEDVQKEFNSVQGIDNASLQQIIFIRDIYLRLYQSGQLVSEIDLLLGRSVEETSTRTDKLSNFNWDCLNRYIDSYAIAESSVVEVHQELGQFPETDESLLTKLDICIEQERGFSFIRLGDGEGTLLNSNIDNEITADLKHMLRTWWGNDNIDTESLREMQKGLLEAVHSADVLGTPDLVHQLSDFNIEDNRLCRAYRKLNELVSQNSEKCFLSAYANHTLFKNGSLDKIIKNPNLSICLISGHSEENLSRYFRTKYSVNVEAYYEIPSEHKFLEKFGYSSNEVHFPEVYNRICSELMEADLRGKLFLIGAGVLGKYYCHLIKLSGGIALDLGSVFDYMLGHDTRKFFRASK